MQLSDYLTVDRIAPKMRASTKQAALRELSGLVAGETALIDPILRVLTERERLASTGIGDGIAIPHGKLDQLDRLLLGLGRSVDGLDFDSVDGQPAHMFFVLVAPENSTGIHLKALARISRLCKETGFRGPLLEATSAPEMYDILCAADSKFVAR